MEKLCVNLNESNEIVLMSIYVLAENQRQIDIIYMCVEKVLILQQLFSISFQNGVNETSLSRLVIGVERRYKSQIENKKKETGERRKEEEKCDYTLLAALSSFQRTSITLPSFFCLSFDFILCLHTLVGIINFDSSYFRSRPEFYVRMHISFLFFSFIAFLMLALFDCCMSFDWYEAMKYYISVYNV